MQSQTSKNTLRIQNLNARMRIHPAEAAVAGQAVAARLIDLIPVDAIVAGYWPVRGELDISWGMSALATRDQSLCLPVIEAVDSPLYFRKWSPGAPLEKGRYGIDIPKAGVPVVRPDALLVPLVAFDRSGHRLGYGAGYYDRTIEQLRRLGSLQVIGVGYVFQEIEMIQPEAHDQKLDVIVTEKGVITCS